MADRYSKDNILEYPKLAPERHYESENPPKTALPSKLVSTPDPMLESLDDLDNLYKIADLLPPDLARIIKEITDVLSKHTQGLIIMRLKRQMDNPTEITPTDNPPKPHEPDKTPDDNPPTEPPDTDPTHKTDEPGPTEKTKNYPPGTWPPPDSKKHTTEQWPLPHTKLGPSESGTPIPPTYISGDNGGGTTVEVVTGGETEQYVDADVDDIFSAEPDVEINVVPSDSLVDLARAAYEQDDADIKEYYTSEMTTISQRFFQVMTALAEDSNMLDYSDLMQDFDGTAVTTSDPNQQHLIDEICKNDVLYDQSLRQMNLTHTAAKTLVMTRGMTAAEGERERYLKEEYKTNEPSVVAGLSNDLLQKNRESAEKKYKESAYNMYKYLDSATKMTNQMLNMKIDSAIAKGQLANTGSNIFAYTPPPQPLPDNVDDNYDTVKSYEDKENKFLEDQKKDQKKASEVDNGSSSASYSSIAAGDVGQGNISWTIVYKYLKKCGYNDTACAAILGNIQQECGFQTGVENHQGSGAFGLCQWLGSRYDSLVAYCNGKGKPINDAGCQLEFMWNEVCSSYTSCAPDVLNGCDLSTGTFKWQDEFEGAPNQNNGERQAYAATFMQKIQAGEGK